MWRYLFVVIACGCLKSETTLCENGKTCPAGTRCDPLHELCVTPAQTTACATLVDGDVCDALGTPGICDQTYCIPGCGDDVLDVGEDCDDGNFASHDGCSSTCRDEFPTWTQWESPWKGRRSEGLVYDAGRDRVVLFGGTVSSGVSDEHWERDSTATWIRRDIPRPSARTFPAMAYDSDRGIIVLFGGTAAAAQLADTWEFDGTTWTQKVPATSPTARHAAGMVYDIGRNKMIMFGGVIGVADTNETWEYDGVTWTKITGVLPQGRSAPAFVWDTVRQRAVLFGVGTYTAETWEYAAGVWTKRTIAGPNPSGRLGCVGAYDPIRQKVMIHGGLSGVPLQDTWEFDGTGWTAIGQVPNPPGRYHAAMTTTAAGVILVGGTSGEELFADVWELTGAIWFVKPSNLSPSSRRTRVVADTTRDRLLLHGGYSAGGGAMSDTWMFDGVAWSNVAPSTSAYSFSGLAYDERRDRAIEFGGLGTAPQDDVIEWDGTAWTRFSGTPRPSARSSAGMTYDSKAGVTVLFGGSRETMPTTLYDDTWEFDGATWTNTMAQGPPAQLSPALAYDPIRERTIAFDANGTTWAYANRAWIPLAAQTDGPEPRYETSLAFDTQRSRIILYGGKSDSVIFEDAWELDGDVWVKLAIAGGKPAGRSWTGLASLRTTRKLWLFGGQTGAGRVGDLWSLQFRSELTPNENCFNGSDDDGDRRGDDIDPDCGP